jgi:hypothetical protein
VQLQVLDPDAEVLAAGRLDPIGAAAEVDLVQVAGEDVALVELALELDRQDRLLELALERPLRGQVRELDVLLGDGRAALLRLAVAQDRLVEGATDADRVDAAVVEELAVLGGEHRLDQHRRQVLVVDVDALLGRRQPGHRGVEVALAVGHVDVAHEGGLDRALRRRQVDRVERHPDATDRDHAQHQQHVGDATESPEEAATSFGHRNSLSRFALRRHSELSTRSADGVVVQAPRVRPTSGATCSRWFQRHDVQTSTV